MKKKLILKQKFLAEIFKIVKNNIQKGTAVIIALLATSVLLLLGIYFVSFSITEFKISQSQILSLQTYYLAEAGVNEAIWRLKNDSSWNTCFTSSTAFCDCENWSTSSVTDASQLLSNSSYIIYVQNYACAQGEIISNATSTFGQRTGRRTVKVRAFKPSASLTEDSGVFSGSPSGEIKIHSSAIDLHDGNIFSNNNINIKSGSVINVYDDFATAAIQEGLVSAANNVNVSLSSLNSSSSCAKNICEEKCPDYTTTTSSCPPPSFSMPAIDFDSVSSASYKSKAQAAESQGQCRVLCNGVECSNQCVFTSDEFQNLLWQVGMGGTLRLEYLTNGSATSTYYVTGSIELKGERKLEIDGILVADWNIDIGTKLCWNGQCGLSQITITDPGAGAPSGILTKKSLDFGTHSSCSTTTIDGLVYAVDKIDFISIPKVFKIKGGVIASKPSFISILHILEIYLDNDIIKEGIWGGPQPPGGETPSFSPVVTIEHWEEVY